MEFFHKITFLYFLLLPLLLTAKIDSEKIWKAYLRGNYEEVVDAQKDILSDESSSPKIYFLKALFEPNAEKAFDMYQNVINNTSDGELRYQSAKKIFEYYYARGFYITADQIKTRFGLDKEVVVHSPGDKPTLELPPLKYILQLGAFSDRQNAEKLIQRVQGLSLSILIKTKSVSGHELHLVWLGPFSEKSDAEKWQELVKEKYGIQSRIKTMD